MGELPVRDLLLLDMHVVGILTVLLFILMWIGKRKVGTALWP